jgi:hypothetical protein
MTRVVEALANQELWRTCEHPGVSSKSHRCPVCLITMRRCCDSGVGLPHRAGCAAVAKHIETMSPSRRPHDPA